MRVYNTHARKSVFHRAYTTQPQELKPEKFAGKLVLAPLPFGIHGPGTPDKRSNKSDNNNIHNKDDNNKVTINTRSAHTNTKLTHAHRD